jgi:hypothetical protein
VRIAFATCSALPQGIPDDHEAARLAGAEYRVWDDPAVDWHAYDRVVLRTVWDYTRRVDEFLAWCRSVGPERLRNGADLVEFLADKRYLRELVCPVVATQLIAPGDPLPALEGEIVVKPNVSAGARDTGRFGPATHDEALGLLERIRASGRTALVQPYLPTVDTRGETALVYYGGELSHVLRKHALLRPDEVAPIAPGELAVAAIMLEDDLVVAGEATTAEQALAVRVLDEVSARFGDLLYARVDLVEGPDGEPLLLELEAVEPHFYFATAPDAAARFAAAVLAC